MERADIKEICKKLYTNLFELRIDILAAQIHSTKQQVLPMLISEVQNAASKKG